MTYDWTHFSFPLRPQKYTFLWTSLVAQMVKHLPTMRETRVQSLGWEDLLEKEMATHSSTLAWKVPWTEKPGNLQSMGSQRVGHNWATSLSLSSYSMHHVKREVGWILTWIVWCNLNLPPWMLVSWLLLCRTLSDPESHLTLLMSALASEMATLLPPHCLPLATQILNILTGLVQMTSGLF